MKDKIKIVFIPFLLIAIATITGYNFLRWTLDIKLHALHLKEDLINYWLPVGVSFLAVILGLRKRVRILDVKGKRDNGHFLYQMVASFAIAIPLSISQTFLETASYNLVSVDNISKIDKSKAEKYFEVKSFFVDTLNTMSYATGRTGGRHNENLTFYLYLASPIKDNPYIVEASCPTFWYAVEYSNRISNNLSDDNKQSEYESFINKSVAEFRNYNFHNLTYFENIPYSDDRDGFIEAIKKNISIPDNQQLFLLKPKQERFEERAGASFFWSFSALGIGSFIFLLMTIIPSIDRDELKRQLENKPVKDDELKFILQFLIPKGNYFITAIIIDLNILVFLIMVLNGINLISPTAKELLEWGGNRRHEVLSGQYWRLFTSTFLHGGLMHLMMNMFGLGLASSILEPVLKRNKLLISYILTGLIASYTSISWHENTVSVGASGAIFGLYGLIIALLVTKVFPQGLSGIYWTLIALFAGVSLLFGLAGGIDNSAHVGGLLSGFVIGLLFYVLDRRQLKMNAS